MSTHIVGFVPPDETWKKHKAVWDACQAAGVDVPEATYDFFDGCEPDPAGIEVDLELPIAPKMKAIVREWNDGGGSAGFEIDVKDIPEKIKTLRFYNNW